MPPFRTIPCIIPPEAFDQLADQFYRETGIVAPGKDQSGVITSRPYSVREIEFNRWLSARPEMCVAVGVSPQLR